MVNPLPVVTISGNDPDYCSLDYPVTFIGSPAGGTWSGIGINPTTGEFTPGSVTIPNNISRTVKVTYHYSDTNGCTDSTSVNVTDTENRVSPSFCAAKLRLFPMYLL